MQLAVVVPAFNERVFLPRMIARLDAVPVPQLFTRAGTPIVLERRLVVVDDGSTDGTAEIVRKLGERPDTTAIVSAVNRGKGAALRAGFAAAYDEGADAVVVQDADLEYDPADHAAMVQPVADGRADFVVGTRFHGQTHRAHLYWHAVANRGLTALSNVLTNTVLTDIECGLKCLHRDVLARLTIDEDRFGVEPELVAKIAHMRLRDGAGGTRAARIYEVTVNYDGRTYAEGKKITWVDGLAAVRCILRYNLRGWTRAHTSPLPPPAPRERDP